MHTGFLAKTNLQPLSLLKSTPIRCDKDILMGVCKAKETSIINIITLQLLCRPHSGGEAVWPVAMATARRRQIFKGRRRANFLIAGHTLSHSRYKSQARRELS